MENLNFGWEEWAALPDIGVPAIKAKIDTGARTSALHADEIEVFGPADTPKVRFIVHPIPGNRQVAITCSANIATQLFGSDGLEICGVMVILSWAGRRVLTI